MTTAAPAADIIHLGSGHLYVTEYDGTIPADAEIEKEANRIGYIQGGATLEYKPTFYDAKCDFGIATKTVMTDEATTLKSGIMTWNGEKLVQLTSTGRATTDTTTGVRTVKIGGLKNDNRKKYLIHFHHHDEEDGDVRIQIIGKNKAGFSMAFAKDKETVIDAEFNAEAMDADGTQIIYREFPATTGASS